MKYCGHLRQNTTKNQAIGMIISYADGKTSYCDALGGNDNFDPTKLKCTLTKGITQTVLTPAKNRGDYIVSGTLTPDAAGGYLSNFQKIGGGYYIWFDSAYSYTYIISSILNSRDCPYWESSNPELIGTYNPHNGATGVATISAGTESNGTNNINLLLGGLASFELTAANTDTLGDLIISLEDADSADPQILSEAFCFTVIPAAIYDSLYGNEAAALATEANVAAVGAQITNQLVECDQYIDRTNAAQWQVVICAKGNPAIEYARKDAFDENDAPVISAAQVIAKLQEPA